MSEFLFRGDVIFIDGTSYNFKSKTRIKNAVVDGGGQVSFSLNKKVSCVLSSNVLKFKESSRGETCKKLGIPVVSERYIDESTALGIKQSYEHYAEFSAQEKTDSGKFQLNLGAENEPSILSRERKQEILSSVTKYPVSTLDHKEMVKLKFCYVNKTELWFKPPAKYRVVKRGSKLECKVWDLTDRTEAIFVYSAVSKRSYKEQHALNKTWGDKKPFKKEKVDLELDIFPHKMRVLSLVKFLWDSAEDALDELGDGEITLPKAVRIESIALDLMDATVRNSSDRIELFAALTKELSSAGVTKMESFTKQSGLVVLLDRIRILKDRIPLSQGISTAEDIYRALCCKITLAPITRKEVQSAIKIIEDDSGYPTMYYSLEHPSSVMQQVRYPSAPKKVLYHATATSNMWGVLSRGLVLPWQVENELGIIRRDHGRLGRGIYFSENPMDSIRYLHPSETSPRGTMFLVVCEVVAGNQYATSKELQGISAPPSGYDSVVSTTRSEDDLSCFDFREFCIFDTNHIKIIGLIEFGVIPDPNFLFPPVETSYSNEKEEEFDDGENKEIAALDIDDILDGTVVKSVDIGLVVQGSPVPLSTVNVVANITDMVGQVIVLHSYHSDCNVEREAKFVFPLSDGCAVSGFEAYIGDKHIVGQLKKKEEARREYRQAVAAGHGAYLMEQEEPDLFSLSLGNIPAGNVIVHIKIIYVTELTVQDNDILFTVPSLLSSNSTGVDKMTQLTTETDLVTSSETVVNISANITMPFKILNIFSYTHSLNVKMTDTLAMVKWEGVLQPHQDFELRISVSEVNRPRMWVEKRGKTEAAMLTFYPDISVNSVGNINRVKILVDCSKSMETKWKDTVQQAMLLVERLPINCLFNISSVGVGHGTECFPDYFVGNKTNKDLAVYFLKHILKPREYCAELWSSVYHEYLLYKDSQDIVNLVLVSDGVVTQPDLSLNLATLLPSHIRIFSVLSREDGNKHYLQSLAKQGSGSFFFLNPKEKGKWMNKVDELYDKCQEPALDEVQLKWNMYNSGDSVNQAPLMISSLFNKHRQIVYGYVPHCRSASLLAHLGDQFLDTLVSVEELNVKQGSVIHKLTARAMIEDYVSGVMSEDQRLHESQQRKRKEEIVSLSLEHSVISPFTSFVAVEEREKDEIIRKTVDVETLLSEIREDSLPYVAYTDVPKLHVKAIETKRHVHPAENSEETFADLTVSESSDSDESRADSSSEEEDDDTSTLIVDLGSYKIKGGFVGDDAPRAVIRSVVSKSTEAPVILGMGSKDAYAGDAALHRMGMASELDDPFVDESSKVDISSQLVGHNSGSAGTISFISNVTSSNSFKSNSSHLASKSVTPRQFKGKDLGIKMQLCAAPPIAYDCPLGSPALSLSSPDMAMSPASSSSSPAMSTIYSSLNALPPVSCRRTSISPDLGGGREVKDNTAMTGILRPEVISVCPDPPEHLIQCGGIHIAPSARMGQQFSSDLDKDVIDVIIQSSIDKIYDSINALTRPIEDPPVCIDEDVFGGCKENLFLHLEAAVVASCGIFFNAPLARGEVNNTALREEVKELTNNMTEALKNLRTIIAHLSDAEKPKLVTAASNLGVDAVCHLRIAKNRHEIPAEHSVAVKNLVSSRKEILVCLGQLEFKDGEEPNQGTLETCNDIARAIENLIKNKYKTVAINCLDSDAQQEVINISKDIARRSSQLCISTISLNPDVNQSRLFLLNLSQEVAYIVESSIDCITNYTSDQELLIGIELCIDEILVAIYRFTQTIESQRKSAEMNERSAQRESSNIKQSEPESSDMSDQELAGPVPSTSFSEPEREKRHLEREVMNSWLETNSKSPWFSNMLASLKYDAYCEILTKFTEKHDISMSQEIRRKVFFGSSKILKILHNEMSIIEDADEPAKIWNQSIIKVISRPEIQLLTDYILEGDLIYMVASEILLKNGLNSLGNLVSDEVLSYVKFVCCVLRLCRAGMSLKVDERNKEARLFKKIVSVTDEDGVEKRWFLRDLDDSTCRVGFSTEKIISLMYYNIFCKKFVDLPRFLTVAWDWSSFFSLLSYIAIKELQYDEKTFFETASVGFDPEQECSILYAGKRMLDKDLSIKSPSS